MEQFEQLLTCAICLDRYRNPKLLPCQHSFCMEPCMDGLVDYVRRQVKCPECRAEHRIPYQGVQGYPTNVTLQRFLELHIEITGELPDPTSGQVMKRCSVCSEKSYCTMCNHCEKEVCGECKGAHMDILRREISRINSQIRRALHRLQDMLSLVERNMIALQTNCNSVSEEVEEIHARLSKALKDRTEFLQGELDRYLSTEVKNLSQLKDNLEQEISNITSNCDLADQHMQSENVDWDDLELLDAKEIFLRTVEFIRNFETETTDYTRRVRFVMSHDPNTLVLHVAGYGELSINVPTHPVIQSLQPPGPGLMRSKSDHRLASQYRQQDDRGYDRSAYDSDPLQRPVSPLGGRKFGERSQNRLDANNSGSRYGGRTERDYGDDSYDPDSRTSARSRIRNRLRHGAGEADSDSETHGGRSVRFNDAHAPALKEREKVLDTEDVAKGPLSGITRLTDSPRVMKKIMESEIKKTKKDNEPVVPAQVQKTPVRKTSNVTSISTPAAAQRQISEDEIDKIKRQNKNAPGSSDAPTPVRPSSERVAALKQQSSRDPGTPELSPNRRASTTTQEVTSSEADSDEEVAAIGALRKKSTTASPPTSKPVSRRVSTDTGGNRSSANATTAKSNPPAPKEEEEEDDDDDEDEETEEETESSSESEETESEEESGGKKTTNAMEKTDIGPLLARSANARESSTAPSSSSSNVRDSFVNSRNNASTNNSTDSTSSYKPYGSKDETPATGSGEKDGAALSSWARYLKSKYGNRGKDGTGSSSSSAATPSSTTTPSRRSSLHSRHGDDDSDDESKNMQGSPYAPIQTTAQTTSTGIGQVGSTPKSQYLQKRRLQFKIGSRGSEPGCFTWPRGIAVGPDNSIVVADSSNHRVQVFDSNGIFTKEFGSYGNAEGEFDCLAGVAVNRIGQFIIADRYNHRIQVMDPSGRFLRAFGSQGTADGKFNYPWGITTDALGFIYVCDKENHRVQVFQSDGTFVGKFGSMGNKAGQLEHPHYIAVSNTNRVIVSDSNNHRVQIFDVNGRVITSFGKEGSEEGEFKFPRGVAVDDQGYISVGDSGNNRIQVFTPDGQFLRAFGCWGSSDGEFKGLEGVAVMSNGNILVCDRENHRIQVF